MATQLSGAVMPIKTVRLNFLKIPLKSNKYHPTKYLKMVYNVDIRNK